MLFSKQGQANVPSKPACVKSNSPDGKAQVTCRFGPVTTEMQFQFYSSQKKLQEHRAQSLIRRSVRSTSASKRKLKFPLAK